MGALVSLVVEASSCLACSCLMWIFDATLAQASRFGHLLIIVVTFGFACIMNNYSQQVLTYSSFIGIGDKIKFGNHCHDLEYYNECVYRQLVYRASLSLFLLFILTTSLSCFTESFNKNFWVMKFVFALGFFVALWWVDDTFEGWSNFARLVSFLWLLMQGLLVLDFAHDSHDFIMRKADEAEQNGNSGRVWYIVYLFTALATLVLGITGLVFLFQNNFDSQRNQFFIMLTLVSGVVTIPISLLNSVNKGLLTPCIIFAYSVFLCWYAIHLTITDQKDTPSDDALIVTLIVSTTILLYCVFFGTALFNLFSTQSEYSVLSSPLIHDQADNGSSSSGSRLTGIERMRNDGDYGTDGGGRGGNTSNNGGSGSSSGTKREIIFFHALMMLVSCYGAMILTNWGASDDSTNPATSSAIASESMWLIVVSQWVFLLTFYRTIQLAYYENSS